MNGRMLKGFRVSHGKTQKNYADLIEKSTDSYAKKERGEVEFTLNEALAIATDSGMDFDEFNAIFYDGRLPYRKIERSGLQS